jgi:hypothetical protein
MPNLLCRDASGEDEIVSPGHIGTDGDHEVLQLGAKIIPTDSGRPVEHFGCLQVDDTLHEHIVDSSELPAHERGDRHIAEEETRGRIHNMSRRPQ